MKWRFRSREAVVLAMVVMMVAAISAGSAPLPAEQCYKRCFYPCALKQYPAVENVAASCAIVCLPICVHKAQQQAQSLAGDGVRSSDRGELPDSKAFCEIGCLVSTCTTNLVGNTMGSSSTRVSVATRNKKAFQKALEGCMHSCWNTCNSNRNYNEISAPPYYFRYPNFQRNA